MGYNKENFIRIRREFEQKHLKAKQSASERLEELHSKIPELRDIDAALSETSSKIVRAIVGGGDIEFELEKLRLENKQLQNSRAACLRYHGFSPDYTSVKYECAECDDTGFVGTKVCGCMKRELILAEYESSGIGQLMKSQSFDTFSLEYYREDRRIYENMQNILTVCREYAEKFGTDTGENLLFIGPTGLGKTHLSTSIARRVIDRAFNVVYDTAQNIFADFEYDRFSRSSNETPGERVSKYFDSELLILDDLGTELTNQFTISCLYNLVNTRINTGRAMIINTNLDQSELNKRYSDRITSRLFGEFRPLMFRGRDVRQQKLMK
ncbi:MAG: ATP-binding protein [Clostridiales bacterium]|nr:ATP-binding protein [Clostridiales bacterium]